MKKPTGWVSSVPAFFGFLHSALKKFILSRFDDNLADDASVGGSRSHGSLY